MSTDAERAAHSAAYRAWVAGGKVGPRPPPRDPQRGRRSPTPEWKPVDDREAMTVCVVSDVHLPHPDKAAWKAFRQWHAEYEPDWTILNGDILDMCAAGRFEKRRTDPPHLRDEIEQFIAIANELAGEAARVTMVEGNHEARWDRLIGSANPQALKGIKGISLKEVCRAHGLDRRVEWFKERVGKPGLVIGSAVVRHGDKQASRYGAVNPATLRLNKSMGVSEVFGHHHLAQLTSRHAHGRSAFALANPCLANMQDYAGSDVTWAHGFSVLEVDQRGVTTPHLILIQGGRFSWCGRTYGVTP